MFLHEHIAIAYFGYLAIVAFATRRRTAVVTLSSVSAIVAIVLVARLGEPLRTWWPIVSILLGYWMCGYTFDRPMPRIERWLMSVDDRALRTSGVLRRVARWPRAVLEYLEAVYFGCFLIVPGGLVVLASTGHGHGENRYWTSLAIAEFGAFAMLPWIQTRPPRAIEPAGPLAQRNLLMGRAARVLLDRASIHVNTFPSGHAAASLAAALAVLDFNGPWGTMLLAIACSIVVASVVGRYHYTADAISGVALGLAAWLIARTST